MAQLSIYKSSTYFYISSCLLHFLFLSVHSATVNFQNYDFIDPVSPYKTGSNPLGSYGHKIVMPFHDANSSSALPFCRSKSSTVHYLAGYDVNENLPSSSDLYQSLVIRENEISR